MSLSAIFDPVVRAYFKRHFGGGDEASCGTGKVVEWDAGVDVSTLPQFSTDDTYFRIADFSDAGSLEGSLLAVYYDGFVQRNKFSVSDGTLYPEMEGVPGFIALVTIGETGEIVPIMVSLSEDVAPLLDAPQSGIYIRRGVFSLPGMFIYGVKDITTLEVTT